MINDKLFFNILHLLKIFQEMICIFVNGSLLSLVNKSLWQFVICAVLYIRNVTSEPKGFWWWFLCIQYSFWNFLFSNWKRWMVLFQIAWLKLVHVRQDVNDFIYQYEILILSMKIVFDSYPSLFHQIHSQNFRPRNDLTYLTKSIYVPSLWTLFWKQPLWVLTAFERRRPTNFYLPTRKL